ncbi:MAG TPA: TonB-dependent receptor [Vicinamibacterales bacterium]|nr:TonB-dependent receptor [Vicinamibacterales bacterium]
MIRLLVFCLTWLAPAMISGVVHDATGGAVPGATVIVRPASGPERQALTGQDGQFTIEAPEAGDITVVVRAGGFAELTQRVAAGDRGRSLDLVVAPAALLETVTVTPTRSEQRLGDIPASVSVLTSDDIRSSPAVVADDVLRQIPTFSLFRRSSSLSTHPTSQGVSLRGIGPSGVSRTLVLVDGTPFNDPFGGWVYWTRVPLEGTDRIEVVDGSSSSLYGNYAMGGVINIVSHRPERRSIELKPQYGNDNSPKIDAFGSDIWGKVGVTVDVSAFNTDGFPVVAPSERGLIDNNATVNFHNVSAKAEYSATDSMKASMHAGYFGENRGNGKIGEVNDTRWTTAGGGVRAALPGQSELEASVFADIEAFHSTFLAVTPPSASVAARSIVRLSVDQHVPTHAVGGMAQWSKALSGSNYFSAGGDWHWVDGDSQEGAYNAAPGIVVPPTQRAVLALQRVSGGTQQIVGAYVQDIMTPLPDLTVTLSARGDHWLNYDAHNLETAIIPGTATNNQSSLPDRSDTAVSPRAAARYQVARWISAWGDIGSGFRAPTLNELYRQFRVGTVLTLPNNQLGPERLVGGEAGVSIEPAHNVTVRTTWFDNRVTNPVSNVTLSTVGATVTQQRQNLGATRIWGVQSDAEYRIGAAWKFAGAYLFNHARVTDGGVANAALVGDTLPQVPTNRGSLRASYASTRYVSVTLDVQFLGRQFDDDQNVRGIPAAALADAGYAVSTAPGLPGYTVVDLTASRTLARNLDVFVGAQNLFDRQYFVGTLPTTTGTPRLVNAGVRVRFSAR